MRCIIRRMIIVMMVQDDQPVEEQIEREAERDKPGRKRSVMRRRQRSESLGHEVEERDPDDGSRGKSENEVQSILETQRKKPAEERGEKSRDGDENDHDVILS